MTDENGTASGGAADIGTQTEPTGQKPKHNPRTSAQAQDVLGRVRGPVDTLVERTRPSEETKAKIFGMMTKTNAYILIAIALGIGVVFALAKLQ